MITRFVFLFLSSLSIACFSQVPAGYPVVTRNDLKDANIKMSRHYTGESLFGYMDGGAELYREYGISDLVATELYYKSSLIKIEVYKMNGPEEAFGIYSVSRYRCQSSPPVAELTCQTSYSLQFCKGEYYISIVNRTGSDEDQAYGRKIGELLARQITGESYKPEAFLPGIDPAEIRLRAVLVRGKLGLMNGAADWEDFFSGVTGYCAMLLLREEKTIISVRFDTDVDFLAFCSSKNINPDSISEKDYTAQGIRSVKLIGKNHLVIIEPSK